MNTWKSSGLILEMGPGTMHLLLESPLQDKEAFGPLDCGRDPGRHLILLLSTPHPSAQDLSGQAHPGQRAFWDPQLLYLKFIPSIISLDFLSSKIHLSHSLISEIRVYLTNDLYI